VNDFKEAPPILNVKNLQASMDYYVTILDPPTNYPWGTREMLVEDLDGHRFRMSGKPTGEVDQSCGEG
jgi:hypothetical protein